MIKQIVGVSVLAASLVAAGNAPVHADAAADGLAKAKEKLAVYTAKPVFKAPGEAFDAKACANGKKQLSIPNSSANPFLKGIIDREKKAGAEVGLQVKEWENQGQPSQWVQGMEFAIRDKYDIVDLISGIDPSTIEPQVKVAKDTGVKVMTSHFYDPSDKQNPLVSSSLTIGFGEVGTILADWATVNTDGKANIVIINSDEVPPTKPLVSNLRSELAAQLSELQDRSGNQRRRDRVGARRSSLRFSRRPGESRCQRRHPDLRFHVPIRRAGAAPGRQDRQGEGRHLQRHAVRSRLYPAGQQSTWTSAKASTGSPTRPSTAICATSAG